MVLDDDKRHDRGTSREGRVGARDCRGLRGHRQYRLERYQRAEVGYLMGRLHIDPERINWDPEEGYLTVRYAEETTSRRSPVTMTAVHGSCGCAQSTAYMSSRTFPKITAATPITGHEVKIGRSTRRSEPVMLQGVVCCLSR